MPPGSPDQDVVEDMVEEMGAPPANDMNNIPDANPGGVDMSPTVEDMKGMPLPPIPVCLTPPPKHVFDAISRHTFGVTIALGPGGCPHIAYLERADMPSAFYAKYAYWDGTTWVEEKVPYQETHHHLDMIVDASGGVHIVLGPADSAGIVWLERKRDGTWTQQLIIEEWPWGLSLDRTSDDRLALLAYTADGKNSDANMTSRHFVLEDGQWRGSIINENRKGGYYRNAEAHYPGGDEVIVPLTLCCDRARDPEAGLRLVHGTLSSPDGWTHELIETERAVGASRARMVKVGQTTHILAARAAGLPMVAGFDLHHFTNRDGTWVEERIGNRGYSPESLWADSSGNLHALIGDESYDNDLRVAQLVYGVYKGEAWEFRTLEPFYILGTRMRWDDERGIPHILTFTAESPDDDKYDYKLTYFALEDL